MSWHVEGAYVPSTPAVHVPQYTSHNPMLHFDSQLMVARTTKDVGAMMLPSQHVACLFLHPHASAVVLFCVATSDLFIHKTQRVRTFNELLWIDRAANVSKSRHLYTAAAAVCQAVARLMIDNQGCRGDWTLMPIPIPYPQKNLWESPQNPHIHRIPKSSIPLPYTLCIFVWCIYHFIFVMYAICM